MPRVERLRNVEVDLNLDVVDPHSAFVVLADPQAHARNTTQIGREVVPALAPVAGDIRVDHTGVLVPQRSGIAVDSDRTERSLPCFQVVARSTARAEHASQTTELTNGL